LVEALRKGYWVVLDELNLAPSDVLEALNRLLDDNRELFLAEKQETIKPHPHFMLFATQNPAGQYGGRKQLSRAFRNRFLELHFTDIPDEELEIILEQRCLIAPSYAKKCVSVYKSLSKSRDASRIFDGRQSFITLRDLFRWALRKADSYERLAEDGYMLIAERVRKESDRLVIQSVLEKELRVKLDLTKLYELKFFHLQKTFASLLAVPGVVWTMAMKKLFVLVYNAVIHFEPVLLIGETGCGKTTICQILAIILGQGLHIVNAHQNSETSDFLGSQRPARKRDQFEAEFRELLLNTMGKLDFSFPQDFKTSKLLEVEALYKKVRDLITDDAVILELDDLIGKAKALFEWTDGPLVKAMISGDMFLLDEISLADDSVLERLNSVLEPGRQLTLVEKSGVNVSEIQAAEKFRFFATMNPGGDYGKKELSPALRNRFTEIWVPQISSRDDLLMILSQKLAEFGVESKYWGEKILDFVNWFASNLQKSYSDIVSFRDILAWAEFMLYGESFLGRPGAFVHGGNLVLIDGIGANPLFGSIHSSSTLKEDCRLRLNQLAETQISRIRDLEVGLVQRGFGAEPFVVPFGPLNPEERNFSIDAPTTKLNCIRVLRAMQFKKPILLEGSPGAGKTSLISTIASFCRFPLVRINLSEQTDLMDLFGSDLPVEGGSGGEFGWRDGPFLKAMQEGSWVLLDELNLASQQVLEGLNACLDHRAAVYIPELDKSFTCHPSFRVFAAQNPQSQGGGRKGLPKSFVNRFTLVYVEELTHEDLLFICSALYPSVDSSIRERMIEFNQRMKEATMEKCTFGWEGSPWEFNLRDLLRWLALVAEHSFSIPEDYLDLIYVHRMRTKSDRQKVIELYETIFQVSRVGKPPKIEITPTAIISGSCVLERLNIRGTHRYGVPVEDLQLLVNLNPILNSIVLSVKSNYPILLAGPASSGKSSCIRLLASICGQKLEEFSLNPSIDALELLGGFEQLDLVRRNQEIQDVITELVESLNRQLIGMSSYDFVKSISTYWHSLLLSKKDPKKGVYTEILNSLSQYREHLPGMDSLLSLVKTFDSLLDGDSRGQFEWMDSVLVSALEKGHWILIDNVNLCSSSVLDRLNSVLETGGNLAISERGLLDGEIKTVMPHKNFRIFFAMDPRHGEISRAMRNRVVELCVTNLDSSSIASKTSGIKLVSSLCLPGNSAAESLFEKLEKGEVSIAKLKVRAANVSRGKIVHYEATSEEERTVVVRGIDMIRNSILSNVRLEGAILQRLIESGTYSWKSNFTRTVPHVALQLAAYDILAKRSSPASVSIRQGWLKFLKINLNNISPAVKCRMDSLLEYPPAEILNYRIRCLNELGLEKLELELVFVL
jgi:midasin